VDSRTPDANLGDPSIQVLGLHFILEKIDPPPALRILHLTQFRDLEEVILFIRPRRIGGQLSVLSGYRGILAHMSIWCEQYPLPPAIMDGRCKLSLVVQNTDFIEADTLNALREAFSDVNRGRGFATVDLGDAEVLQVKHTRGVSVITQ
jgi:hypothetical protein